MGKTITEIARIIGIRSYTLRLWIDKYSTFEQAYTEGYVGYWITIGVRLIKSMEKGLSFEAACADIGHTWRQVKSSIEGFEEVAEDYEIALGRRALKVESLALNQAAGQLKIDLGERILTSGGKPVRDHGKILTERVVKPVFGSDKITALLLMGMSHMRPTSTDDDNFSDEYKDAIIELERRKRERTVNTPSGS